MGSVMPRRPIFVAALAVALLCPAAASAQLPARGPLLPQRFAVASATVPHGPVGKYPEDWAECVKRHPSQSVVPPGIDPRGVDPAAPDPLLGLTYFVDRMEPAYADWVKYKRRGQDGRAALIWRLARQPRARWFGRFTRPHMVKKVRGFLDRGQCDQPGSVPRCMVMRAPGRRLRHELPGRRCQGGCAHAGLVRRLRSGGGQRPRGDRLRARLARHARLPGRQPPRAGCACSATA